MLTALDVAQNHNGRESITVLRGCFIPRVSNFSLELENKLSSDDRNALLVILGLLLTATYQASLSLPGCVWQGDSSSNSIVTKRIDERELPGSIGTPVMGLVGVIQGFLLHNEFWKETILAVGYSLFVRIDVIIDDGGGYS
ncbi:hypothetical protein Gohar_013770 [Gossypium harknessii]|uniref:Uncharacterized protein n=1 Tax=Gossypium harknessii TaxID=34285 RepID=A0A7J9H155_9ROSI|nr:hypothetical protein [Gossypium harknessii]